MRSTQTILIVDDNPATVNLITHYLESPGMTVLSESDPLKAKRIISRFRLLAVILNFELRKKGISLIQEQLEKKQPNTPIYILTEYPERVVGFSKGRIVKKPIRDLDQIRQAFDGMFSGEYMAELTEQTPATVSPSLGRVLIVDDEPDVAFVLSAVLGERGWECCSFGNGKEALDYVNAGQEVFDIAIVDLVMPVMGGAEFIRHLRHRQPGIRILPISAKTVDEMRDLLGDLAEDGMSKPVDLGKLLERMSLSQIRKT